MQTTILGKEIKIHFNEANDADNYMSINHFWLTFHLEDVPEDERRLIKSAILFDIGEGNYCVDLGDGKQFLIVFPLNNPIFIYKPYGLEDALNQVTEKALTVIEDIEDLTIPYEIHVNLTNQLESKAESE